MTISSSLNAGVMGLNVNANKLATISDNIANSKTYGYKRADTDFSSMVLSQSNGAYTAGGVRASSFRLVDAQGALLTTSNPTDLSVGGRGLLPVTTIASLNNADGEMPTMLTTTGSFRADENGILRTTSGLVLLGWPSDSNGNVIAEPRDSFAGLTPVKINFNQLDSEPTTRITLGANLPANATQAGAPGTVLDLPVEYFDNIGAGQTLTAQFTPTVPGAGASNTWTLEFLDSASGGAVVAEFTLVFDDTRGAGGSLLSVTPVSGGTYDALTGEVAINVLGGPMAVKIGTLGTSDGLTQLSADFAPVSVTKNGTPVGSLATVQVNQNGYLEAVYNTGFSRLLYQIPLADVANPNGLTALDNQAYAISPASGPLYLWDAGDGPTGSMISYALEESTTDIAGELTALIQTQRAYSSNAKVIQTVDEMLQETTNIKR